MITKPEPQYLDIEFKYTFSSPLGPLEGERYIQDIAVEIIKTDEYGSNPVIIGKGNVKILLLAQAINDHYDIFEIFDTESYTMRIGNMIYDFDNYEIKEDTWNIAGNAVGDHPSAYDSSEEYKNGSECSEQEYSQYTW